MNLIIPHALVSFADLDIHAAGAAVTPFLQPAAKEALRLAIQDRGQTLPVTSAYRTVAQQFLLRRQFEAGLCGITAAAQPGRSNHEEGLALDIPDFAVWRSVLESHGWQWFGPRDQISLDVDGIFTAAMDAAVRQFREQDGLRVDGIAGPSTRKALGLLM